MKRFFNKKTAVLVVVSSCAVLVSSCVNKEYELSEDKINTNVTVFQEGLTLPLGSTAPILMNDLYSMLDSEFQELIQKNQDGKYGFVYSGNVNLTDSLASVTDILSIDALTFNESFSFDLSDVSLDGLVIEEQKVAIDPIDVSSMLNVPDISLPVIETILNIKEKVQKPNTDSLNLNFGELDMTHHAEFSSLAQNGTNIPYLPNNPNWSTPMTYEQLANMLGSFNLPSLKIAESFDEYVVEVPVRISLPGTIESVNNLKLHEDANVDLDIKVVNPLFTEGKIIPHIDIDLHNIFHVDRVSSGEVADNQHILDDFELSHETDWEADHVYHVDALALTSGDWKKHEDKLVLDKVFKVTVSGEIENQGLKTSLEHLYTYGKDAMDIVLTIKFNNFTIENVEMDIAPIRITSEPKEIAINVPAISLPEVIVGIDHVDLQNDLTLDMNAALPEALNGLDIKLETLDIEFPEGLVVEHENFNNGKLTYSNISLKEEFKDNIKISRLNLPEPVGGMLSYNGNVKVTAKAIASGTVNSRDLLSDDMAGDIDVQVKVDYAPVLKDYSASINDYSYNIEGQGEKISEKLPDEVGKMEKVLVYLENDPEIIINLDYPTADGAISIIPDKANGLKVFFPQMLKFKSTSESASYKYDPASNSISFTKGEALPKSLKLAIDRLEIVPVHKEGEGYFVEGEMKVEGGVCLEGTTVNKSLVDALKNEKAEISFSAVVPELVPVKLALNQYVATVSESMEFEMTSIEDLPEIVEIKSIDAFDLDNVYLNLSIDASSIAKLMEGVQMSMDFDVKLPELINVKSAGEGNIIKIAGTLNKENKIVLDPIKVDGLDFSFIDLTQGSIDLGKQSISINGNVTLNNISLDMDKFKDTDLTVAIEGSLATEGTEFIKIAKIAAKVNCQFELDETVDLSSLTEGLGDKLDFALDLNRFHLDLDLKTNLSIPVQLSELKAVPYKGGVAGEPKQIDKPIALNTNPNGEVAHSKIRISNLESDKHDDPDYQHVVFDILSLIRDMPDSIQLHLNAGTKENATFVVEPSTDYVLAADYKFEIPLELGEEFKIEFADTLSGLPSVLSDVLALGSLGLSGEVTNSFPLAFDLEFQLLDADGNRIPMSEGAGHQTIKAGNLDGTPNKTELNIVLGVQKGIEIPQISAVKLIFRTTSSGAGFAEDNFVQVQLSAIIPEGVSVDLKDYMSSSESESQE